MRQERPNSAQPKVHGTYTKYFQPEFVAKQNKCKLGVIHPIPVVERRERPSDTQQAKNFDIVVNSLHIKHVYQEKKLEKKPVSEELAKPFLYVEKVVAKRKTEDTAMKHSDVWVTNTAIDTTRKPKYLKNPTVSTQATSHGGDNVSLYDIEEHKRAVAKEFFEKLYHADPQVTIRHHFTVWSKSKKIKIDNDLNIQEDALVRFIKDFTSDQIKEKLIRQFFSCFKNTFKSNDKATSAISTINKTQPSIVPRSVFKISFKALCYNYETYIKSKTQVNRILSDKAAQQRYVNMKIYIDYWHSNLFVGKSTMKSMRDYQNRLRSRFIYCRDSYQNPFTAEIEELKRELLQPMIKYDKTRKEAIEKKIQEYNQQHERTNERVHTEYEQFSEAFEDSIVHNHNLFFKKKTLMRLLGPLFSQSNRVTKEMIQGQVGLSQAHYQQYLEVLSKYTIEFGGDKKMLKEETFTLAELAHFLSKSCQSKDEILFMKKLVKRIKVQHCLKKQLSVDNMDQFPGDEEISMELLNKCFEIECTRVLFKNQIWSELLQNIIIPARAYDSRYHAETINMNITIEAVKRLFDEIDRQMALQLNRSREICRMVEGIHYDDFKTYAEILKRIDLSAPFDDNQDKADSQEQPAISILRKGTGDVLDVDQSEQRKVKFADMIYTNLDKIREINRQQEEKKSRLEQDKDKDNKDADSAMKLLNQSNMLQSIILQRQEEIKKAAKDMTRAVFARAQPGFDRSLVVVDKPIQNFQPTKTEATKDIDMMKTLTKSFYIPDPLNINALDIRFHDQSMSKIQQEKNRSTIKSSQMPMRNTSKLEAEGNSLKDGVIGQSILLSNLPKVEELPEDPLRISKFLMKTLDVIDHQQSKHIEPKRPERTIKQGVDHNYFKEQVDFEKKPAVFDCEGASKYSLLLPVNYYSNSILQEPDKEKWYLRSHHVETLTENPLSKKDNIISTEYKSLMQRVDQKKRPEQLVIEQNVRRKDVIIKELEERVAKLKDNLQHTKRDTSYKGGVRVPVSVVDGYFNRVTKDKQDKELEVGAYESILYDLRKNERDMLVNYRGDELARTGYPQQKWWELKDPRFVDQYVRHRNIQNDERKPIEQQRHLTHIHKLENQELY